eukprot:CAMPEP_0176070726 /NCGR_PEP_ID=MMETSP0120_2-20121206/35323_1 /TAXON_ID=160619 /ORGANISM="Kryptoperidinium foliaceum, Strain CCMP 1326" /LENGTH=48 /DNA_ID= /DNA_START= /DNA_END= /DNA_ORIENTATION=
MNPATAPLSSGRARLTTAGAGGRSRGRTPLMDLGDGRSNGPALVPGKH